MNRSEYENWLNRTPKDLQTTEKAWEAAENFARTCLDVDMKPPFTIDPYYYRIPSSLLEKALTSIENNLSKKYIVTLVRSIIGMTRVEILNNFEKQRI